MKEIISVFLLVFSLVQSICAQVPPGTEIYMFDLISKNNQIELGNPQNITNRKGYDNQPYFHTSQPIVYYSSANESGRTDIIAFNYKSKKTTLLTSTNEREYSPTLTPDQKFISCIIQRDNGEQNLGKYPVSGGEPVILINNLVVGYHAWLNNHQLIAFVLGEPQSLHFIDLNSKSDTVIAQNIGRSLHKIPNESALTFTQKLDGGEWLIKKLNPSDFTSTTITTCLPGNERDITWTPDGKILSSDGNDLYVFDPKGKQVWQKVAWPGGIKITTVSRLAVNKKGNKLALVMAE
jgi:Tol biopolymer transport system component